MEAAAITNPLLRSEISKFFKTGRGAEEMSLEEKKFKITFGCGNRTQYLLLFIAKPNTYYSLSPNPILITLYHQTQYLLLFITKPNTYYSLSQNPIYITLYHPVSVQFFCLQCSSPTLYLAA